jgi:hypothetical protein
VGIFGLVSALREAIGIVLRRAGFVQISEDASSNKVKVDDVVGRGLTAARNRDSEAHQISLSSYSSYPSW